MNVTFGNRSVVYIDRGVDLVQHQAPFDLQRSLLTYCNKDHTSYISNPPLYSSKWSTLLGYEIGQDITFQSEFLILQFSFQHALKT